MYWEDWRLTGCCLGRRVFVTSAAYSSDGRLICGGLKDGTIQLWDVRGKFGRSAAVGVVPAPGAQAMPAQNWSFVSRSGQILRGAHEADSEICCLSISINGNLMLSRGADSTLKLWDLRKFKAPVATVEGLETGFANTQCCFSPGEDVVITGVGSTREENGYLALLRASDLSLIRRVGAPGNVVAVNWHPKLNEIFIGCGSRKEGTARVLYDPAFSSNGVLLAVGRRPRKEIMADFTVSVCFRIPCCVVIPLCATATFNLRQRAAVSGMYIDVLTFVAHGAV